MMTKRTKTMNQIIDTDKTNKLHKPIIDADEQQKEQTPIIIVEWHYEKNPLYL